VTPPIKGRGFRGCGKVCDRLCYLAAASLSPEGTAENSPGRSPGYSLSKRCSPEGTAENSQDEILGWLKRGEQPGYTGLSSFPLQPSLRDCSSFSCQPRIPSWANFNRPCGTEFGNRVLTHALWLLGYVFVMVEFLSYCESCRKAYLSGRIVGKPCPPSSAFFAVDFAD
jgi:hypothetical protein